MEELNTGNAPALDPRSLMDQVKDGAASQLSVQKERATDGLGALVNAARHSSQALRDNQQPTIAHYVEKAGEQIENFTARLRDRDANDLLRDAQQFARERPAVFVGAAFALGVLAVRFLKSSGSAVPYARGARGGF